MSKKTLKLVGQRPMLLALIMATLTLGLLFSGWLTPTPGKAQQGMAADPTPNQETTNCVPSSVSSSCVTPGSIILVAPTNSPAVVVGSDVPLTATYTVKKGQVLLTITYTNTGNSGDVCTNTTTTIPITPTIVSSSWTWSVSGVGANPSSGTGLPAAFTPTCSGCGRVDFTVNYTNASPCNSGGSSGTSGYFFVAQLTTNCTSIPPAMGVSSTNFNFCIGSGGTLSVTNNNVTNAVWVTTNWPSCPGCTNVSACGPTNYVSPVIVSNWWTVSEPGNYSTNGPGLSATFNPTNCGGGTVTFNETYKNNTPCDPTNVYSANPISLGFNVVAVDSLTPDLSAGQGGLEDGSDPPNYWVCPCDGDVIVTASSCPSLTADQLPACWSFTGGVEIDKLHHKISKAALLNGDVTFTVTCGTSTKTIVLKTDKEDAFYWATGGGATCDCDDWTDSHPFHDKCGNSLAVNCAGSVRNFLGLCTTNGHFEYRYNGIWVGTCLYDGGMNSFLFKTTKHNCRILRTWHLTQRPTTPTKWTVTKYDCLTGSGPSQNCRTAPTWDDAWGNPADEPGHTGYPTNSCENQGTPCP